MKKSEKQWFVGVILLIITVILFIGLWKLDRNKAEAKPAPIIVDIQKQKYLSWMYKNSNESKRTLEEIYNITSENINTRDLMLSLIAVESGFNPKAKSDKNAMCLTQVRPSVWLPELKKAGIIQDDRDLWDEDKCIAAGTYVFKHYLKKSNGNLKQALGSYVGAELNSKDAEVYVGRILTVLGELMLLKMEV